MMGYLKFQTCELIGSMFLVIAAVAPMILFIEILGSSLAIAVVADALAVGFVLFALIEIFGPICTAYFNPAVCLALALNKEITIIRAIRYSIFQIIGGIIGLIAVHLMFYDTIPKVLEISTIQRSGGAYLGEILGTFILVICIMSLVHQKSSRVSLVVGFLVGGMLVSTSSTMFANPQVTIARIFTYSAAGIQPIDAIVFIILQFFAATFAFFTWKYVISNCTCPIDYSK
jgi:glycerol uptake facilitator-like aquaporin